MELDLSKIKNVHFIGIGGIGISAIARMMLGEGKNVTGQDMQDSEIISELRKAGADISIGQSFENIPIHIDLVVYTIAIENYDPELYKKLKSQTGFLIKSYPEMLHEISKDKYTIAISGTHGKTTTTGMIAQILLKEDKEPTVIIGSLLIDPKGEKSNFIAGNSDYFVVEACEYKRSFLNLNPKILVITNIDADHLDYYKDIEDIKNAFRELALKVPEDGFVVCDPKDKNIVDVVKDIKAKIIDYSEFFDTNINLKVPGKHNKKNAACAKAVAHLLDIDDSKSEIALSEFSGTWRRFEFKGNLSNGAYVYDDYAHHPTEISATLEGFRELYPKEEGYNITVIFQPHLFSRTKILLEDFGKSFSQADQVMILPIYFAREENDGTTSAETLAKKIVDNNIQAVSFENFDEAFKHLKSIIPSMSEKNIIVTMGAGEAFKIGDLLF